MSLPQAVKRTLAYFEIFNYYPSQEEIYKYLIGAGSSLLDLRPFIKKYPKKQIFSALLLKKLCTAKRLAMLAGRFPGVRAVFLTGDLAAGSAKESSDVDFLVVTSRGWLLVVRWGLTVVFSLLGLRRSRFNLAFTKTVACFNIFLEEDSLSMSKERRNLYVAQEIARMKPLLDKGDYHEKFLAENRWVFDFLPNFKTVLSSGQSVLEHVVSKNAIFGAGIFVVEGLRRVASRSQLIGKPVHANKTSLGECNTGKSGKQLFLHPKDLTSWVLMEYKKNCQRAGVTPAA